MNARERIFRFFMWWTVLGFATWVGGTMFYMLVVVPLWSASPPESVRAIFTDAGLNKTIWNFFGPPWMALRNAPLIAALVAGRHFPVHRRLLLISVVIAIAGVVGTLIYIYPINAVLMGEPGQTATAEEIRSLVRKWVIADRIRFAAMTVGFIYMLRAFAIPCPSQKDSRTASPFSLPSSTVDMSCPVRTRLPHLHVQAIGFLAVRPSRSNSWGRTPTLPRNAHVLIV